MDTSNEFRVFVAPTKDPDDIAISGISQYRYWEEISSEIDRPDVIEVIAKEATRILEEIKAFDPKLTKGLSQGFIFDIHYIVSAMKRNKKMKAKKMKKKKKNRGKTRLIDITR